MHFPFNILLAAGCGVQREPPKIPSAVAERSLTDENVQIPASCSCGSKLSLTISPRYPLVNIQSFHSGTLIYSVFLCFVAVAVQISRKWYISFVDVWSFCTPDSAFPVLCPRLLFFFERLNGGNHFSCIILVSSFLEVFVLLFHQLLVNDGFDANLWFCWGCWSHSTVYFSRDSFSCWKFCCRIFKRFSILKSLLQQWSVFFSFVIIS